MSINSKPQSPRIEAIIAKVANPATPAPSSPLLAKIRETAARLEDAYAAYAKLLANDPAEEAVSARIDQIDGDLRDLE